MSPTPNNRSALVTGAGRRLGRFIARGLAAEGWSIAIHFRSAEEEAISLRQDIQQAGGKAEIFMADFSQPLSHAQIDRWFEEIHEKLGVPGLLVNNASLFEFDSAESCSAASLFEHYKTNLVVPVLLTQGLYRHVRKQVKELPRGEAAATVINLLDQKLSNINPDFFSYTLAKSALETATQTMAQGLAPWLRVVGLSPGFTCIAEGQTEQGFAQAHQVSPLGESSRPEEIAQAACWLARARAVTGTTLIVDGGQHLVPSPRDLQFLNP